MRETHIGRRTFLAVVGLGVLGMAFGTRFSQVASPIGAVVPQGIKDLVPTDGWRIYAINPPWPTFHPGSWRLEVGGAVEQPLSLSWDEFTALPSESQITDFHCVTGWSVSSVHWQGVRLQTLWDMAKPTAQARVANFVSMEKPYIDTLTMRQTTMPQVMLAHTMNGQPLSRAHGAPVRLVIPEMYGYKNVKWLTKIELTAELQPGFWEQNGYDVDAWVGRSNGY